MEDIHKKVSKLQRDILEAENDASFYDDLFMRGVDPEETFYKAEHYVNVKKSLQSELDILCELWENKNSSNNNKLYYALTIGSSEKENIEPCLKLMEKFKKSKDNLQTDIEAYFERGENGYIHIHALLCRSTRFQRSVNEMRKRFGSLNGKAHNWDLKRIQGLAIPKWKNYIKKDSQLAWNIEQNAKLNNSQTPQEQSDEEK